MAWSVVAAEQPGDQHTQVLVGEAGRGEQRGTQRAGQGHDPRITEPQGRGPTPLRIDGGVRDPLKGWTRKDTTLADSFSIQDALVDRTGLGLQLVEVGQAGVAAQVTGCVDDGLDPHRATVLQILPDPGVPVEHVEDDPAVVPAVDRGAERADRVAPDPTPEDDLDIVR